MINNEAELFGSYTIHSIDNKYTLTALIDFEKNNSFSSPSLEFLRIKREGSIDLNLAWDNPDYLLQLHSALKNYNAFTKNSDKELEILEDLSNTISGDRTEFVVILAILEKGIEIGLFTE